MTTPLINLDDHALDRLADSLAEQVRDGADATVEAAFDDVLIELCRRERLREDHGCPF